MHSHSTALRAVIVSAVLSGLAGASQAQEIGPGTGTEPYLLPNDLLPVGSVVTMSVLTVGDSIDGYRMVGIPDGLGALKSNKGGFTLLMNHELPFNRGTVRQHGSTGSFVSRWSIGGGDLSVKAGEDQALKVLTWDTVAGDYVAGTTAWNRLCSADLPASESLFYRGLGTNEEIFLNGEEYDERFPVDADNTAGRAFAHLASGKLDGQSWQLPRLGRMAFENVLASPYPQEKTVVMLMDDADRQVDPTLTSSPSELYVYVGKKMRKGNPIERAGLTNGDLLGFQVLVKGDLVTQESNEIGLGNSATGYIGKGTFRLHSFGDVSALGGAELQDLTIENDIIRLQRIEDGVWDPRPQYRNDFYFVTTGNFRGEDDPGNLNSRLWRVRFKDVERPERGGTIEILLAGDEGHQMLDNMTMDHQGRLLIQEDVGGNVRLGKIWLYSTNTGELIEVAAHNPRFFLASAGDPAFLTQDEESSGIIDAEEILGKGWFLLDSQAHYDIGDDELVEGGQLLAMYVDPRIGASRDDDEDDDNKEHGKDHDKDDGKGRGKDKD